MDKNQCQATLMMLGWESDRIYLQHWAPKGTDTNITSTFLTFAPLTSITNLKIDFKSTGYKPYKGVIKLIAEKMNA